MLRCAMPPSSPPATETSLPAADLLPRGGRVLMIRLSALGDVLFALETVAALHHERPDVAIDFLVEDRFAPLLAGHPHLARVIVYPRKRWLAIPRSLLALRAQSYDVVLDLHGILKSALHVLFARARTKLGAAAPAAREGSQYVLHRAVPMPVPLPHRADLGHLLLKELGLSGTPRAPLLPFVSPPHELFAGLPRPLVLLYPGTSAFAAFKRWPIEHFAALAQRLTARGLGVVVGFGPGEADLAAPVLAAAPAARPLDGGRLGLLGLAGAMHDCAVVVAADTGPLHIAAAVGARGVALFGPKDELRYGPRAHGVIHHEVLFHAVPCRPCKRRNCVTPQCVLGIPLEAVEAAVLRQLSAAAHR